MTSEVGKGMEGVGVWKGQTRVTVKAGVILLKEA